MSTLTHEAPIVNLAPADARKADALAYLNDSADHDPGDYRDGWDAERFEPTAEESAELAEHDPEFHRWLDRLNEERLAQAFAEYDAGKDYDELVEAFGCIEARRM